MLMENSVGTSHGTNIVKKSRALDLQKLCSSKLWASTSVESGSRSGSDGGKGLKRKNGGKGQGGVRKRSKKEVLLSSLSSGVKSKKCAKEFFQGRLNGDTGGKSGLEVDKKTDNGSDSLDGGLSLSLNSNVSVPKRPRDLVRRRKVVGDVRQKQEGTSSSKASSAIEGAQLNEGSGGNLLQIGNADEKVTLKGASEGGTKSSFIGKMKRKKNPDDSEKSRPDLFLRLKGDDSHSSAQTGGSLNKKASKSHKKTKKATTSGRSLTKEIKKVLDQSSRIRDDSQEDEENLEANAARMLSSRFDPSCTGFSSGGKITKSRSTDGLSAFSPSSRYSAAAEPSSREGSDPASCDAEGKVLRPRGQSKGKKPRRYYYEVISKEVDSYWVINHRIKIFWPLDQSWYLGRVIGYDLEKKLHHIKYDDREEEWVDLHNERFKLLLLPSEVPENTGGNNPCMHDNHARKGKNGETSDIEANSNSYMESEPIISWLAHSTSCKSPPFGVKKKQKACNVSAKSHSSSSDRRIDPRVSLEVGSSGRNVDNSVCSSVIHENPRYSMSDGKPSVEKLVSDYKKTPIVYYRKRFHKRKIPPIDMAPVSESVPLSNDSLNFDNMVDYIDSKLNPDELIWNTDDSGFLKLSVPVTSLKVFRFELGFSLPSLINKLFGWLASCIMLHHGTLISLWPRVHLEILFVDNIVGLRFLLFEGCFKQALLFISLVMVVFNQSNPKVLDQQLPVTSIRFRLFGAQDLHKQLVFAFYNFREVSDSKWSYLYRKLNRHCSLTKELPPSECTYDNVMALCSGCIHLSPTHVSHQPSSVLSLWKRSRPPKTKSSSRQSALLKLSRLSCERDVKHGEVPAFALSFAAAPTFFISLHLKLLMEHSIPSSSFLEHDSASLTEHSEDNGCFVSIPNLKSIASVEDFADRISTKLSDGSQDSHENEEVIQSEIGTVQPRGTKLGVLSTKHAGASESSPVGASVGLSPLKGMAIEIPSCDSLENDAVVSSPIPTPQSIWHQNRGGLSASTNMSPARSNGKHDLFRNGFVHGPKKPRTQVSYSLPLGGQDYNSKSKFHHAKGFSYKRIRKASEKKTSEALKASQKNMELLSCDANVLVTSRDRGWRECGARVVLEVVDNNEWRLAVKGVGNSKYSYKVHQFMQPGSANRYTHAMMWKGGKDWILEFPDRTQWATFKALHEECYNRNLRAASMKNIPIPGVCLIEENDDNVPETPFVRPPRYYRHTETDVDIALDPSRVLYNMDSDDERWIGNYGGLESKKSGCGNISDEMFEKAMDVFEKVSYAKQCDHISFDELEEDMAELGPLENVKAIYEHWLEKRRRKGMPLLRHLQLPLWEKYQQQVKEWEQAVMKCNATPLPNGSEDKAIPIEKPPMFAFCLKPRGLEVPHRGSKQRSQKRLPLGALPHAVSADSDGFHSSGGRRSNGYAFGEERAVSGYNHGTSDTSPVLQGFSRVYSPREAGVGYLSLSSDGSDRNHYPKLGRNKSRKLYSIPPSNDNHIFGSNNSQRNMSKRSASHGWNMGSSEWPKHYYPDGFQRHNRCLEQLDPSEVDEFRLRDAASAARHAVNVAKMKRENAQRMLCRADLAMHKAASAITTAEAVKTCYKEPPPSDV